MRMASDTTVKLLICLLVLLLFYFYLICTRMEGYEVNNIGFLERVGPLQRQKDSLQQKVWEMERNIHRYSLRLESLDTQIRDRLQLLSNRKKSSLPMIYFITPTAFRVEQKADLTRLSQTLAQVPNLHWIVVEDAETQSKSVSDIIKRMPQYSIENKMSHYRSRLPYSHLSIQTPSDKKMKPSDRHSLIPRGVSQRNAALEYIRSNLGSSRNGVIYFGDDDNTYDWRLFDEMRRIKRVGVWPVGAVGGLLAEHALLDYNGAVTGFNALWKPERPFPIDMAAFAVNITLVLDNIEAGFSFDVPEGYQESHFLQSCGIASQSEMESLGDFANKVYVWHTRTEKSELSEEMIEVLNDRIKLSPVEKDALGID